jgi:hypothetical protein
MADVRVSYVRKRVGENSHEAITHVGGTGGGGWEWTREQVIQSINNGSNTFYVLRGEVRADIGVVSGQSGLFLRAHAGGNWTDDLVILPPPPAK